MPTYLFYPRRADGVSLTFIAEAAPNDVEAMDLAAEIADAHDCVGVFVWEPGEQDGKDRFVGREIGRALLEPGNNEVNHRQWSDVGIGIKKVVQSIKADGAHAIYYNLEDKLWHFASDNHRGAVEKLLPTLPAGV